MRPLRGTRIVDASIGLGGNACAKLLADAGADVMHVALTGAAGGARQPMSAGWEAFLRRAGRVVEIDPSQRTGRAQLHAALAEADLYLTSSCRADAERWGLAPDVLGERYGDLVTATVTPFGEDGPYAGFVSDDMVISALCGLADATPGLPDHCATEDEPPVQSLAPLAEMAGAITAAIPIFAALDARRRGRRAPRHIEVATLEAAVAAMVFEWGNTSYGGTVRGRRPVPSDAAPNCYLPCADGQVVIAAFTDRHWAMLVEIMGGPAWATDAMFATAASRAEHWDVLGPRLQTWASTRSGADITERAQARGVPCCMGVELKDAIVSAQAKATGGIVWADGTALPADPIVVDGRRRSSAIEDGAAAAAHIGPGDGGARDGDPSRPLSGIRVLDLGQFVAGPYAGELLAALGADVIAVESATHSPARMLGPFAGHPRHDAGMMFNHVNRGKRSVELDIASKAGRRELEELLADSDVVVENFSRGAAHRLHLGYGELAAVRPDVVVASISGFGRTGPWADYVALHSTGILLSGLASVTRDTSGAPRIPGSIYPDPLTGAYAAFAVQQALAERDRTGRGSHVEVSMLDVLLNCMGGLVPGAAAGATHPGRVGRFLSSAEPRGYVATTDPDVDAKAIERCSRREAMDALQAKGVRAGAVLDMAEVMADPHLASRGFVCVDDHPVAAGRPVPGVPWRYDGVRPTLGHAPRLGEHTDEIMTSYRGR